MTVARSTVFIVFVELVVTFTTQCSLVSNLYVTFVFHIKNLVLWYNFVNVCIL